MNRVFICLYNFFLIIFETVLTKSLLGFLVSPNASKILKLLHFIKPLTLVRAQIQEHSIGKHTERNKALQRQSADMCCTGLRFLFSLIHPASEREAILTRQVSSFILHFLAFLIIFLAHNVSVYFKIAARRHQEARLIHIFFSYFTSAF